MGIQRPQFGGEPPDLRDAHTATLGRWRFALRWRVAGASSGITIHVFGPAAGADEEVLRFDCFDDPPHLHLGWSYRDAPFVPIDADDPFRWAIDAIRGDLPALLTQAGAAPLTDDERAAVPALASDLRHHGERLELRFR